MMAVKGTLARLLVDQWDFSCETSGIDLTLTMNEEDVTSLCDTAMVNAPTLTGIKIAHNGYIKTMGVAAPGSIENELYNRMGVQGVYVAAMFGIDVPDCPAYVLDNTFGANMEILAPAKGVLTLNGAWGEGDGGHRGIRAYDSVANATGAQVAIDLGAAGTQGGEVYLFVQAITGTATNATIQVQSSTTSGGTYTTVGTFTISAAGSYEVDFAGAVNRWVRLNVTSLGGSTGLDMVAVVCVRGVTE
jgi:hypothetical protein